MTLVTCLSFGVEIGLFIGLCITILRLVLKWAHPKIEVETILVFINLKLFFSHVLLTNIRI